MFKTFYSTSDWRIDLFLLLHWLFWIQSNFQVTKKQQQQQKSLYEEQTFAPRVFHSVSVRTLTERDKQTQAIRDTQKLAQNVFPPWKTNIESHVVSSLSRGFTRPFQKRFREVFGNARILIFYLSIKAWEEKSLPKSHLGCFFLVFGEGKATKENMSIFWFIWPLSVV